MAAFAHFLKSIFIPLFLAAVLYLLLALLIVPFVRRHRTRYSQYLPMPSSAHAESLSTWRTNVSDALYILFVPSRWRRTAVVAHHDDDLFDDEEGEDMVGFSPIDERRRAVLEHRGAADEQRRVGRHLEAVFKDESEDEMEDERRPSLATGRS
ncbi:hypothetical protein P153DRAFT_367191 [Dothidotthia symphoricarpi CBS 119687]|uniref:Uncharacterized protein n=1 Tax=Dothidotthia symphoricarpi CBS 119687 TaxID=1392245 RepID=A0A6A6ADQ5_9PLEO|nr:uncharacterized protein P153DRAFT_367191 [Dothidotthia symphoricarpi CBS 119687]KAF2128871.1 hypothetical protein P153DRAFT_367191 [Dothidotthia symphoricarpi CBS 119687]